MTLAELLEVARADWRQHAACVGRTNLFFAEDEFSQRVAVAVCQRCAVRGECHAEARRTEQPWVRFGVWGGFTSQERGRQWDRRQRDLTSPD